ncbi:MAG: T6SS effector BTH_I2691 family protein [Spongiibacteraceae bacterium]
MDKQGCRFCDKNGLLILPLRYAALAADDASSLMPDMPGKLGNHVKNIELSRGKYAPRLLRPGYLYVLINRQGIKYWEAYAVLEDAYLYKFPADTPPTIMPTFSCKPDVCGLDASCVSVDKVDQVTAMYFLFTPTLLTKRKLDEYKQKAESFVGNGKMQKFDPKGWVKSGARSQQHSLQPAELDQFVAEWKLVQQHGNATNSSLGKALNVQMFPATKYAYSTLSAEDMAKYQATPSRQRLIRLKEKLQENEGAAFVVHDAIGITQELNDFRNAPNEALQYWLQATDEYGASNEHRLKVYYAIEEVRAAIHAGVLNDATMFRAKRAESLYQYRLQEAERYEQQGRFFEAHNQRAAAEELRVFDAKVLAPQLEAARKEGIEIWKKKYESRLDTAEIDAFGQAFNSRAKECEQKILARADQHIAWMKSEALINAFDSFDDEDPISGHDYAYEFGQCVLGMTGTKAGEAFVDALIQAKTFDRPNLYMRGVFFNQKTLIADGQDALNQMEQAAGSANAASEISTALVLSATKRLVSGFKSVDSAFDEWARNQTQEEKKDIKANNALEAKGLPRKSFAAKWGKGYEIRAFLWISDVTRSVFRTGVGSPLDKALTARISGLLYSQIQTTAIDLRYEDLMLKLERKNPPRLQEGHRGRTAEQNKVLAQQEMREKSTKSLAGKVDTSLDDLMEQVRDKRAMTLKEIKAAGSKAQPTNNYHQVRLGAALGALEAIALAEKLTHFENRFGYYVEVAGSALSIISSVCDIYYSAAKSIREIAPYKDIHHLQKAADMTRGGFKLLAGVSGFGAGLISAGMDIGKLKTTRDENLIIIYSLRAFTGTVGTGLSGLAAFSYSESFLSSAAKRYETKGAIRIAGRLRFAARGAEFLATRVRLLVWVARFNMAGLVLTAAEVGYMLIKDDDLQNWCEKSVFRKIKFYTFMGKATTKRFHDADEELLELAEAQEAVGLH